ncbi:unnamed protein product [Nesidiocoris tenuis]|uniref:Uncharacterized protein n=1 Tax=Nesidiocoris tenuis TaxID=355587 RepID=A0A6H5GL01_9HEMI|nr:unnamed protein product [Nesidiocoris tenuis]
MSTTSRPTSSTGHCRCRQSSSSTLHPTRPSSRSRPAILTRITTSTISSSEIESTQEERLSIVGGKRAPQFYMPTYEAEIPENQKKDSE